jgi:glycosyltransferase involved in cell wall biosynthesis
LSIVYLVNSKWPTIRGAERLLLRWCERALSEGQVVTILAPAESSMHRACKDIGVRSAVADFSPLPWKLWRLRAVLRELRPDIVHGMSIFPVALIRRFGLMPATWNVRYFAYVSIDPTSSLPVAFARFRQPLLALRNAISRREAPRIDAIFAASETIAERLSVAGIRGRIIAIPGVVDAERLEAESHQQLELPAGRPRIVYAAFLEELKGVADLVAAFALIAEAHPTATLLIAGDGPQKEPLADQARGLGVGDRVHLLGHVEPVASLFSACDVFVSPSHSEALGISIMQAMALGLPCVCTDVGGISDAIDDGVSGLLVPAHDPPALAAAIGRLLSDPAFAASVAGEGRALVTRGTYSLDATLDTVFAEYAKSSAGHQPA